MQTVHTSSEGPQGTPFLRADQFDGDEDDWYIMQRAAEIGADPRDAVRDVRAAIKRRYLLSTDDAPAEHVTAPRPAPIREGALPMPPGFVGALADFIYQQAPRPVVEVAIVGALGLMAGIAGRAWHIPKSGLNLYIVLVARSAIGKEAMHSGIDALTAAAAPQFPYARNFADPSDFASGPALTKSCLANPSFVNVAGEIGHKFMAMKADKEGSMRTLRKQLTTLYSKSGPGSVAGGIIYSNAENNVASTEGVAFSMIGETTPGTFYESVTDDMMRDGFMSRFCVVEYDGDRPDKNEAPATAPSQAVVDHLVRIMSHAHDAIKRECFQLVAFNTEARTFLDRFGDECDGAIRAAGEDETQRQLWSRAELKALRIAALLAVGDNYLNPLVTAEQAEWAVNLVRHGIAAFDRRLQQGDVGDGSDGGREQRVLQLCREFVLLPSEKLPGFLKGGERMQQDGIVPRKYLQQRTLRIAAFEKHPRGSTAALNSAITTAITNGALMEVKKHALVEQYSFHGQAYRVLNLN